MENFEDKILDSIFDESIIDENDVEMFFHFVAENEKYKIFEIIPTQYEHPNHNYEVKEIAKEYFPYIHIDENKDYVLSIDGKINFD